MFVQLGNGIEGLIHQSELSDTEFDKPQDVCKKGDMLDFVVLAVDSEERRFSLSRKARLQNLQGDDLQEYIDIAKPKTGMADAFSKIRDNKSGRRKKKTRRDQEADNVQEQVASPVEQEASPVEQEASPVEQEASPVEQEVSDSEAQTSTDDAEDNAVAAQAANSLDQQEGSTATPAQEDEAGEDTAQETVESGAQPPTEE